VAASQRGDAKEVLIHGCEPAFIVLVGVVEKMVRQSASVEFELNDTTGRIKARKYFTEQWPELDDIVPGRFVSIVGSIRLLPELHVSAQCLRLVTSPDEISYHMIESAHAAVKLRKNDPEPQTPAPKRPIATPQTSSVIATLNHGSHEAAHSPEKDVRPCALPETSLSQVVQSSAPKSAFSGHDLSEAVMSFLRNSQGGAAGESMASLLAHLAPTSAKDVRDCLAKLNDEGFIYSTIDDDHFAVV